MARLKAERRAQPALFSAPFHSILACPFERAMARLARQRIKVALGDVEMTAMSGTQNVEEAAQGKT
jgi:hypothetical protein